MRRQNTTLVFGGGTAGKVAARTMAGKKEGERLSSIGRHRRPIPTWCACPARTSFIQRRSRRWCRRHREFGIQDRPIAIDMARYMRASAKWSRVLFIFIWTDIMHSEMERSSATVHSSRLGPFTSHYATGANARLLLTGCSSTWEPTPQCPTPVLREAQPMTHIEALDLQRRPEHFDCFGRRLRRPGTKLVRLRRLGSRVTLIERSSQLVANEDPDVSKAILQLFQDEGIGDVLLGTCSQHQRPFRRSGKSSTQDRKRRTNLEDPTFWWRLGARPTQRASDSRRPNRGHGKRTSA